MPTDPLFIFGILENLGLGEQLFIAVALAIAAWEAWRVIGMGKKAGGAVGSLGTYLIILFVAAAAAIALDWVDPNPSIVTGHIASFIDTLTGMVSDYVGDIY